MKNKPKKVDYVPIYSNAKLTIVETHRVVSIIGVAFRYASSYYRVKSFPNTLNTCTTLSLSGTGMRRLVWPVS